MKTRKQIDRLFREQLKNLEVTPPKEVWVNIAAALKKEKKNRRSMPLWYKLAGIAAALLLFVSIGSVFFSTSDQIEVTIDEDIPQKHDNNYIPDPKQENNVLQEDRTLKHNTKITSTDSDTNNIINDDLTDNKVNVKTTKTALNKAIVENHKASNQTKSTVSAIASESVDKNNEEYTPAGINKEFVSDSVVAVSKTYDKEQEKTKNFNSISESREAVSETTEEIEIAETKKEAVEDNKKSLLEYIVLNEETEVAENETLENRWEVSPNFAPVYYNTLDNGSSIDSEFSNNSKSGDVNYSYGVHVSYAINKKLSVRSGLNKVDLSYVTNDIEFAPGLPSEGLQSITYKNRNYIVAIGNRGTLKPPDSNLPTMTEDGVLIVPRSGITSGTMTQQLNYFEIPLELKYALLDSKIGLNFIGGISTLLLNNNEVSIASDGFNSIIGKANNLNELSFSTNIGFGFDYKLSKRFIFNLEPMFKYQINPYSDTSIDFNPYYLGVYSGFSYRF